MFGVHFVFAILLCFLLGNTRYFIYTKVCHSLSPTHSIAALCSSALFHFTVNQSRHSHHTSEHTHSTTQTHTLVPNLRGEYINIFWFANEKEIENKQKFAVCRRVRLFICFDLWMTRYEHFRNCFWCVRFWFDIFWFLIERCDVELLMTPCWGRDGCCGFRPVSDCYLQPVIHLQQCQEVALETLRARLLSPIVLPLIRRMMNV